ncbi:uncharacterized protein LOC118201379 [Stegodyphus dumicola]|uniref:uncharacterized protein LOC118201379 n=1 Tax=Stegodyphus dumicola TaxID=202533 RepID=UPI0015B33B26|nr:uncharacterized protein LOC118201379 [Stegodyphus dumicola]
MEQNYARMLYFEDYMEVQSSHSCVVGGWWERIIQMVKKILRRIFGRACLRYEELCTILCDTEAVINARPLNYLSEDPEDLMPLTPSRFIQDTIRMVGVPDLDHIDEVNINKRYIYQQKLRQDLRKRFRDEYLTLLIQSIDNKATRRQIYLGDVVLVGSHNKKRLDWPLGRVIELFQSQDNCVRVEKVKTAAGELIRPVQQLYPLEMMDDTSKGHINKVGCGQSLGTTQ